MVTATITNTSGALIGYQEAHTANTYDSTYPIYQVVLPVPFDWLTIANSASATAVCQIEDLTKQWIAMNGFSAGDILQQMVQKGQITISFANVASDNGVIDNAIAAAT